MKLLNPNEIRADRNESNEQAKIRAWKLANEESRLARDINILREKSKEETEKINNEVAEHKKQKEIEKAQLISEVENLREQKARLLAPIDDIRKDAEEILRKAETHALDIRREMEYVARDREKNQEFAEHLKDREGTLNEWQDDISKKADKVINEESRLKSSAERLAEEWVKYHKAVTDYNILIKEFENKSDELCISEQSIINKRESLDQREKELAAEARLNRSEREAIKQAKIHLGIKV